MKERSRATVKAKLVFDPNFSVRRASNAWSDNPAHLARANACGLRGRGVMSALGVRRAKAALSSGCKPHPAAAPAGSNRSSHGGNEVAEAFD
jgi:hypothetical protein